MDDPPQPLDDECVWEGDDYDGPDPLMPNATREERLEAIRAALARSDADMKAGRTVDADVVLAEMRAMIDEDRRTGRVNGPADG